MTSAIASLSLGYLLGCINPAKMISRRKNTNLEEFGTKNLGATNTMLAFGMRYGVFVMVFDILKGFLSVKLAKWLFPKLALAGIFAGCGAVIGHIYPYYLHFRGGKGLAAFGGMVLAVDPVLFLLLLSIGVALGFLTDYAEALPISAALLFPLFTLLHTWDWAAFWLLLGIGVLIVYKHRENLRKICSGEAIRLSAYWKSKRRKDEA